MKKLKERFRKAASIGSFIAAFFITWALTDAMRLEYVLPALLYMCIWVYAQIRGRIAW